MITTWKWIFIFFVNKIVPLLYHFLSLVLRLAVSFTCDTFKARLLFTYSSTQTHVHICNHSLTQCSVKVSGRCSAIKQSKHIWAKLKRMSSVLLFFIWTEEQRFFCFYLYLLEHNENVTVSECTQILIVASFDLNVKTVKTEVAWKRAVVIASDLETGCLCNNFVVYILLDRRCKKQNAK